MMSESYRGAAYSYQYAYTTSDVDYAYGAYNEENYATYDSYQNQYAYSSYDYTDAYVYAYAYSYAYDYGYSQTEEAEPVYYSVKTSLYDYDGANYYDAYAYCDGSYYKTAADYGSYHLSRVPRTGDENLMTFVYGALMLTTMMAATGRSLLISKKQQRL